ncbi:TPA: hypothetical protein DCP81_02410, partial [Candidatus Azambacteria bacterium]|nr:hypothetical protein [Candidatus Azambacteria bacterium]
MKVWEFDSPPPGVGLNTVIGKVPSEAMSEAGMAAVRVVEFTNVVVRSEPLNLTTEEDMNSVPETVMVNSESPTVFPVGSMLVVVGTGLFTVNVWASEVPPPGVGLNTVIKKVPAAVKSEAGMVAVSWVELT